MRECRICPYGAVATASFWQGKISLMEDLLFEFTERLRGTPVTELSLWISDTRDGEWIAMDFWAILAFQVIHTRSIAASFVAVLVLHLRTFGFAGSVTLTEAAHRYSRVLWWGLA